MVDLVSIVLMVVFCRKCLGFSVRWVLRVGLLILVLVIDNVFISIGCGGWYFVENSVLVVNVNVVVMIVVLVGVLLVLMGVMMIVMLL